MCARGGLTGAARRAMIRQDFAGRGLAAIGRPVLFIYNTQAGKNSITAKLDAVLKALYQSGFDIIVCPVGTQRDAQELLTRQGGRYDAVLCAGGDGTLHHTVNAMAEAGLALPVGYLPAGSTNDFAATAGLSEDVAEGCARLATLQETRLDLGDFCGQRFCYVAAFGMFTDVSYSTPRQAKNLLGHMAYILEGVKRLNLFQSWHARVQAGDFCVEDDFWYGSFTNTRSVGGFGFPNADKVRLDDGEFEVMLVRCPKNLAELNALAAKLVRQEFDGKDLVFLHAKEMQVTFQAPVPWTLDGEFGGEVQAARLSVLPGALRLLGAQAAE